MKKRLLLFVLVLLIYGCAQAEITEKTAEERLAEGNYEDTTTDHMVSSDYNSLEQNIDILLNAGNMIGPRHYDELEAAVNKLEKQGENVSALREKLSRLNVAPRQGEEENKNLVHEKEDFYYEEKMQVSEEAHENERSPAQNKQLPVQGFRSNAEIPTEQEREQLPSCDDAFFTTAPVDLSQVREITPIGNLGPPGHTFPTDHTFLHVGDGSGKAFDLVAPADVYIISVSYQKGITQDPIDYTIYFALCREVIGYFNHVKALSPELSKIFDTVECEAYTEKAEDSCTKILLDKVEEGTMLGKVGLKQGNFDFGLIDLRKKLGFANPKRHPTRTQHIQCPYDYYKGEMQKQFLDLIERDDERQCGITMQDVPGSLKGAWFHESAEEEYVVDWNVYLAFVNDNEFPDIQVVSIAGIFTDPSKFKFNPRSSGFINREFSQVKADGKIYCYQAENVGKPFEPMPAGKILVQLMDDDTLNIEHQEGKCAGSENFNNPEAYNH